MKKTVGLIFLLLLLAGIVVAYIGYTRIFAPNVHQVLGEHTLFIPTASTLEQVTDSLSINNIILNRNSFIWCANKMKYGSESRIKPGKYAIKGNLSNRDLISQLRIGKQKPVVVTFKPTRDLSSVASAAGQKLEADSSSIMNLINNSNKIINTKSSVYLSKLIPNSYQFNWSTNAKEVLERIDSEYEKFWQANGRIQKAADLNLSRDEVHTLASIVERETNFAPEKPRIAGVYLNRLKRGIALQADPTVVYAKGDFTIRRVLKKYLEIDSPYNTYKYVGLPPGPIGLSSTSSIDAVLNYEKHNYIFFCAKPDAAGQHNFAETLQGHNRNARKFHNWLNSRGIRK